MIANRKIALWYFAHHSWIFILCRIDDRLMLVKRLMGVSTLTVRCVNNYKLAGELRAGVNRHFGCDGIGDKASAVREFMQLGNLLGIRQRRTAE